MDAEFERSFLDWSCEDVCQWLSSLSLSTDYSQQFKEDLITGSTLISLDREALEDMGISDSADRLKILQQITTMRADLVTSGAASPTRRIRSPIKGRQFRDRASLSNHYVGGGGGGGGGGGRRVSVGGRAQRSGSGGKQTFGRYVNVLVQSGSPRTSDSGTSVINSPSQLSTDQTSSDSQESSRISTPDKQLHEMSLAEVVVPRRRNLEDLNKLRAVATLRYHNVKRLSRSLDHLFPEGEDIFSVYHRASQQAEERGPGGHSSSSSSRLVEILREENASLKRELETYYQRVRKLQKIEQEVEGIRDAHRMLETSSLRREGLGKALRLKLEQEVSRLREENMGLKAQLNVAKKQVPSDTPSEKTGSGKRELRRRDTMIMRLIQQNKEAAIARERLEKDLLSTRAQLKENSPSNGRVKDGDTSSSSSNRPSDPALASSESDSKTAVIYSESIDKLKSVLSAMHNMSQKREKLEKNLRFKLEREIKRLKVERGEEGTDGHTSEGDSVGIKLAELQLQNTALEADVVKWEHKCLELVAEQQMSFEATVIPKEARIAALERSLAEKIDTCRDLRHQKATYLGQLTEANRCISDMEIKLSSAQSSLQEKDSVIHMMQKSFLEPDEDTSHTLPPPPSHPAPPLHPLPPPHHAPPPLTHHTNHHYQPLPPPPPPHTSSGAIYFSAPLEGTLGGPEHETRPEQGRGSLGSYTEMVSYAPPPPHTSSSVVPNSHWAVASSVTPRSPTAPVRPSPLTSPATRHANYRSQSVSPIKALIGGGGVAVPKPRSAPAANYVHKGGVVNSSTGRRNGYSTHHTPPTNSRYVHNPLHHHANNSNSAPNSPNVKNSPRKPRISHPNMRLLQVPAAGDYSSGATTAASSGGFRQGQGHTQTGGNIRWKSNTGPGGSRRTNYKPLPSPRVVKSKTPPPDYRLVSVSGGRGGGGKLESSPKVPAKKQRHRSVEDMLGGSFDRPSFVEGCGHSGRPQGQEVHPSTVYPPGSLELFQSLIGQNGGCGGNGGGGEGMYNPTGGLVSSLQVTPTVVGGSGGGGMGSNHYSIHQHSQSSPTNDKKVSLK